MRCRPIRLTTLLWQYLWVDVLGINHFWSLPLHRNWLSLVSLYIFYCRVIFKVFKTVQVESISPFLNVFLPILVDLILVMMLHWVRHNKFTPISVVKVSSRLCKHFLKLLFVFWLEVMHTFDNRSVDLFWLILDSKVEVKLVDRLLQIIFAF